MIRIDLKTFALKNANLEISKRVWCELRKEFTLRIDSTFIQYLFMKLK